MLDARDAEPNRSYSLPSGVHSPAWEDRDTALKLFPVSVPWTHGLSSDYASQCTLGSPSGLAEK